MILKKLEIQEQIDTPYICLDPAAGVCDLVGKSYPEDITAFYTQVVDWFEEYTYIGEKDLTINMKLSYFNSASQKIYTEIFEKLTDSQNFKVSVNWYYAQDDDEILENGKIYQGLTDLTFNFIPY